MRVVVLFIVFMFFASSGVQAYCLNPFGCDKPKLPPVIKNVEQKTCSYTFRVKGEKGKPIVLFVFGGPCGKIKQVGIIDLESRLLMEVHKEKIVTRTEYFGKNKRDSLISSFWGELIPIQFYEQAPAFDEGVEEGGFE